MTARLGAPLVIVLLGACALEPPAAGRDFPCSTQDDCAAGYHCDVALAACVEGDAPAGVDDAGPTRDDGGAGGDGDAGRKDAGVGEEVDGGHDAGVDPGDDAGVVVVDAGLDGGGGADDAGNNDAGNNDAGNDDAGNIDAGNIDAGNVDAGNIDAGNIDAGNDDAGNDDAGNDDAGNDDAGNDDAGSDDAGNNDAGVVVAQVLRVGPELAPPGTVLWIEGEYPAGSVVTVTFPGGAVLAATVLADGRAHITVPAAAGSGELYVDVDGDVFGPFRLRAPGFVLGLSPFQRQWEQTSYGRQVPRLLSPRSFHAAFSRGPWLYVLGGLDDNGDPLASIERARVNADGSLGKMRLHSEPLPEARANAALVALSDRVYLVGGITPGGGTAGVLRASLDVSGELGAFASEPSALLAPRVDATAHVLGRYLYVVAGRSSGQVVGSVERARILPDGALGPFSEVTGVALDTPRRRHVSVVSGQWLYVFGGRDDGGPLDSIERAPIAGDGSLGDFTTVGTLNADKSGAAAFRLGDLVYLSGGLGSNDTVEELIADAAGTLSNAATSSSLADNREGHAVVVARDRVWAIGGASGGVSQRTLEHARIHDGSAAPTALASHGALALGTSYSQMIVSGDWLYLLGGYRVSGYSDVIQRAPIAADGSLGAFTQLGTLPGRRGFGCAAVAEDRVFLIGGNSGSSTSWQSVHAAPVESTGAVGTFVDNGDDLANAFRLGVSCVVLDDQLYAFGGDDAYEVVTVASDGTLAGDLVVVGALQSDRDYTSVAVVEDRLYVFGDNQINYERATISGAAPGSFTLHGRDPGRYAAGSVLIGPYLYFLGGLDDGSGVLSDSERADVRASPLSFESGVLDLGVVGRGVGAVVLGDFVYRVGGRDDFGPLTTVERAPLP